MRFVLFLLSCLLSFLPLITAQTIDCPSDVIGLCGLRAIDAATGCAHIAFNSSDYEPCICSTPGVLLQFSNTFRDCLYVQCPEEKRENIDAALETLCDDVTTFTSWPGFTASTVPSSSEEPTATTISPSVSAVPTDEPSVSPTPTPTTTSARDSTTVGSEPTNTTSELPVPTSTGAAAVVNGPGKIWAVVGGVLALVAGMV
ncbi:hypothetical protein TWF481_001819 [Arthrobotrys musiformis]|uniref:Extracellular membrane protein CFEM domain-containing protein n=1 Tax=Arthrobotrys musiformis TaxID=47236 RepID=A0AAV9VUE6_9PEZI